jgi:murein DD-endopeptidase MepM/ murein hydrolase activator NlpD
MAWKVGNYNALQSQFDTLRQKYAQLEQSAGKTNEQLATLQVFAAEVSLAYGVKRTLEGPADISSEAPLLPTFSESLEHYNFLKTTTVSRSFRKYPKMWQTNIRPSLWPIHGPLRSSFGRRTDPFSGEGAFHTGVDIAATSGTMVKVTADGTVASAGWSGAYGRLVVVDHGGGMHTWYAHLSRIDVIPGQEVRRGQIVGASGSSGRATSPHLHYEVRQNGTPINPYVFLARSGTGDIAKRDLPF